MWQQPCCVLFCLYTLPLHSLCITTTRSLFNYVTVMPLVIQVYFWNHSGSLNDPNEDTWSEIMNYHSDCHLGSTFGISHLLFISPFPNLCINDPWWQLSQSSNKMCIIFGLAMIVGSLFSMVTPHQQESLFMVVNQMTIHSWCDGLFLRRWGVVTIRLPWHLEICWVIWAISQ